MTRALLLKELREHRWVVLALWLLCALGLLALVFKAKDGGSPLVAFQQLVIAFGTLLALSLANRLVVREYAGRTQLFLETLPVTRARVVTVKWLLGAGLLLVPMAAALAVIALVAQTQVALTGRFVAMVFVRGATFLLFFYALAFAISFTGRYRFVVWAVLWAGAFALDTYAQLPLKDWPPVQLVTDSMVFERFELPLADLVFTWACTWLLVLVSAALALAAEGSLVTALSRRMSHREKVVVVVAAIVPLALMGILDERKTRPRFELKDAIKVGSGGPLVGVARAEKVTDEQAMALGQALATDLGDLQDYLNLTTLPSVFVLPDASADSDVFLRAYLPASDGVVVRGALGADHFDAESFRAFVIREVLDWYSRGRGAIEERRWLLDGFAQWWVARGEGRLKDRLRLRSVLAATLLAPSPPALEAWLSTRERLGDCLGDALAWRAVQVLADGQGAQAFRALLQASFKARPPDDVRAPLFDASLAEVLQRAGAPSAPQLAQGLQAALAADRAQLGSQLDGLVIWPAHFDAAPVRPGSYEVRYRLGEVDQPGPDFSIRYLKLGPWEGELARSSLSRVDATGPGVLPLTVVAGTRLFVAAEVRDEQLACTVRFGARRWSVP